MTRTRLGAALLLGLCAPILAAGFAYGEPTIDKPRRRWW